MPQIRARLRRWTLPEGCLGILLALGGLALAGGPARAEPMVRSPQDAACRMEARGRVFSTPNPRGLEPEVLGRQIYHACMRRIAGPQTRQRRHRHR
ncbi:hypothetical protein Q8W71_25125 [Methylobacterium sp. NEAU 140]|uniref:hypothetical protein n=1 Tax=Methylobacterium sp. NEAU 140 TaxID=3064945 RepID=UPI002736EE51|nr:hypothetical protein [Methylobacterium sp. NEAU 140]MDP4025919.1 hypothetical protein [Methylobacterium sp. NEAU 140]